MANNALEATVGKPKVGGGVSVAPLGTTLPTDATTALGSAFVNIGYITEDGVTNTIGRENTEIKAWGGDTVLNVQTSFSDQWQMTMMQVMNVDVLKTVFGNDNVTGALTTGITVEVNSDMLEAHEWVIDMLYNNDTVKRVVIPNATVIEIGDIVYVDGDPVGYEVTLGTVPDASGNTHYEYIQKSLQFLVKAQQKND